MEEEFPIATVSLSVLLLAIFLFTSNFGEKLFNPQAESHLEYYENLLGFIPARPKIYSLITYTLIHADLFHLLGNLIFLIIAGLVLERRIGKIPFISIYISSGCIAAIFDIINRLFLGISMHAPFVGASGSIFGLIAIASLTRPMEKIPTFLVLLSFLPLFQLLVSGVMMIFTDQASLAALLFFLPFLAFGFIFLPRHLPIFLATILFIFSWVIFLALNLPVLVSHLGHLGGLLGGFFGMLLFPKQKS
ncbi:MAG: rhomboid family intramembrane serine protease [Candidatus Aenigmatarchaeota archaeon]